MAQEHDIPKKEQKKTARSQSSKDTNIPKLYRVKPHNIPHYAAGGGNVLGNKMIYTCIALVRKLQCN